MPRSTLVLWAASIVLNGFAAFVLIRLSRHFRLFWLFIIASASRSLWLLSAVHSRDQYIWIASHTAPILIGIEALAVLQIFWLLTDNYPRWHFAGTVFLSGLVLCGAFGAWLLQSLGVPADWSGTWQAAYLLQRHWMVGLAIVMMLMRWMVKTFSSELMPVRPITQRAADCLAISIALGAITAQLVMIAGTPVPIWARCAGPIAGIINGLLWTVWLPQASVTRGSKLKVVHDHAEMERRIRAGEMLLRKMVQAVR